MNSQQVANILAFYSYYHPKANVDLMADEFKVPASVIVNGLYYGEKHGLFTANREGSLWKEITVMAVPDNNTDFGKDLERIKNMILETITNLNADENDILEENLFIWIGAPLLVSKVCLQLLINEGTVTKYFIRDLKDPKSKYYYPTLTENKDKMFASKNFKKQSKKKKDEHISSRK